MEKYKKESLEKRVERFLSQEKSTYTAFTLIEDLWAKIRELEDNDKKQSKLEIKTYYTDHNFNKDCNCKLCFFAKGM